MDKYKTRLAKKDRMIYSLIKGLPILFVENFKNPDTSKVRDGSFVYYIQTQPEYDSDFIEIKWICEGINKAKYNSLMMQYFCYLESIGLDVHPILLGDRPYKGRIMKESYYEMNDDEIQSNEELTSSITKNDDFNYNKIIDL